MTKLNWGLNLRDRNMAKRPALGTIALVHHLLACSTSSFATFGDNAHGRHARRVWAEEAREHNRRREVRLP